MRPSADSVALPSATGSETLSTCSSPATAASDASMASRCAGSVTLPSSAWKTIGLASDSSDEKERAMTSLAAALSEPGTVDELVYLLPAVVLAKTSPMSSTSHAPITNRR